DRPERLLVVLLKVATPTGSQLQAFTARPEGWALQATEPAFTIQDAWPEAFPELTDPPPMEEIQRAWLAWCQPRGIPVEEAEACTLELVAERLRVLAPPVLLERLPEALQGETWLLLGEGPVRRAA